MATLTKVLLHGNERLDLTDFNNLQGFVCSDFDQIFKRLFNVDTQVVRGFRVFQDEALTNALPTVSPIFVELDGAVVLHTNLAEGPLFYVGAAGTAPTQLNLTSSAVNYIEATLISSTGSPDTRAFWDPTANSGAGAEFAQTVDTVTNLDAVVTVNTSGFTGGDNIPIAQIEVNGSGDIVALYDRRNMFFRLGRAVPYNDDFQFPFSDGRNEAVHTLTLTGGAGTYNAGEVITGGTSGTTAKVVAGGTTTITITSKDQPTFTIGETITGATSGAVRTLETAKENFNSADKSISSIKDLIDGLMTEITRMKFGTTAAQHYWFENAVTSLQDARPEMFLNGGGTISWDSGTGNLSFSTNLTIPITGTLFTNTILQGSVSPIVLAADGTVAYIDVNRSANVNITVSTALQSNYVPQEDRFIIARRVGTDAVIEDRLQ